MSEFPESPNRPASGKVDMSPEAILQRLDEVAQLYELGTYLSNAKPMSSPDRPLSSDDDITRRAD